MQATPRRLSVTSSPPPARRRLIRIVLLNPFPLQMRLPAEPKSQLLRWVWGIPVALLALVGKIIWAQMPGHELSQIVQSISDEARRGSVLLPWLLFITAAIYSWWLSRECSKLEGLLGQMEQNLREEFDVDSTNGFAYHPKKPGLMYCLRCVQSSPLRRSVLIDPTSSEVWHCVHSECRDMPKIDLHKLKGS